MGLHTLRLVKVECPECCLDAIPAAIKRLVSRDDYRTTILLEAVTKLLSVCITPLRHRS